MTSLDGDSLYRALKSRDPRFDGRFFTGVRTTGIYCRPICPAQTPKRKNVEFYACAAAAEAAGFRACKRCRPETSPGTPAWLGTSASVSRALKLIAAGELDDGDLEHFAARLGMTDRHLRRLFAEHLGASPIEVAQTRRTHFARRLIDETNLPMTQVAFQAGFSSVRRFNTAVRAAFGQTPTELRRKARSKKSGKVVTRAGAPPNDAKTANGGELTLRLPYRPPLNWKATAEYLRPRMIPGVEAVMDGVYRRTVRVGEATGVIEVAADAEKPQLVLRAKLDSPQALLQIVERVRRIFDLGADPLEIDRHLRRDPLMRSVIGRRKGVRVPGTWDGFELAVRAILGQQVSVRGATTLAGRLVERFGTPLAEDSANGVTHLFPTAAELAEADFNNFGMPQARCDAIRNLARAVCDGEVSLDGVVPLEDFVPMMTELPGVGPWTAHYVAMRALGEPDAFPSSDLGLRRALIEKSKPVTAARLEGLAEPWRPWRSYAAMWLWNTQEGRVV